MDFHLFDPSPKEIIHFMEFFKEPIRCSQMNYSRLISLYWFGHQLGDVHFNHVCVISGSEQEPELSLIQYDALQVLSYEQERIYDLDTDWSVTLPHQLKGSFDLVICNQVLEHISSPFMAFKNFAHICRRGGYLYVSVPVLNCIHGEPYFYSSGYHPRLLNKLAYDSGFNLDQGAYWGSAKYAVHAITGRWCTERQLCPGLKSNADLRYPILALIDGRKASSKLASLLRFPVPEKLMTDCWGVYRKKSREVP